MSDTTPERTVPDRHIPQRLTLPDALEQVMRDVEDAWAEDVGGGILVCDVLRQAIAAALEPDRALRERCERLRRVVQAETDEGADLPSARTPLVEAYEALQPGDLADDILTATSSAHEGRE